MTIVTPHSTYIEADVQIGQDTVIRPFTFIGCGSNIGSDCVIGPFAHLPAESIVPDDSTIVGNERQ